MPALSEYIQANGYYDEEQIMKDGGMDARAAAFADIFGGTGEATTVDDLPEPYQSILYEARAANAAKLAQEPPRPERAPTNFISEWEARGSTTGE